VGQRASLAGGGIHLSATEIALDRVTLSLPLALATGLGRCTHVHVPAAPESLTPAARAALAHALSVLALHPPTRPALDCVQPTTHIHAHARIFAIALAESLFAKNGPSGNALRLAIDK
jgi:hypothetical protein